MREELSISMHIFSRKCAWEDGNQFEEGWKCGERFHAEDNVAVSSSSPELFGQWYENSDGEKPTNLSR